MIVKFFCDFLECWKSIFNKTVTWEVRTQEYVSFGLVPSLPPVWAKSVEGDRSGRLGAQGSRRGDPPSSPAAFRRAARGPWRSAMGGAGGSQPFSPGKRNLLLQ